jgi:hypothetical protein
VKKDLIQKLKAKQKELGDPMDIDHPPKPSATTLS